MNAIVEHKPAGALAIPQSSGRMAVADIISHVQVVQEVMRAVMKPGVHYGTIPGAGDKMTLLKPGAEVLCMAFRVGDTYEIEDLSTADKIRYRVNCIGTHQVTGGVLGSGLGEASSSEEKYKWRKAICTEEFEAAPANLRRKKFAKAKGGGFYMQDQVRTEPDDLANTVLKMANKRAKVAMTINVTACGDMFNQDLEDLDETLRDHLVREDNDTAAQKQSAAPVFYPQADFDANMGIWKKAITKGTKPDDVIAKINSANPTQPLSEPQKEAIRAMAPKPPEEKPDGVIVQMTHAQVLAKMKAITTEDDLNVVMDLAGTLQRSDAERAIENSAYDQRITELRK
jgi:hypothetical protein